MIIESLTNKKIKEVVKLKNKNNRDSKNKFIIETKNLIEEAIKNNLLEELYVLENTSIDFFVPDDVNIFFVKDLVFNKISSLNTSKYLGICKKINDNGFFGKRFLLLDNIQDPGNLGTIIRTALGFNIDTIIISVDSCDMYNDKVIRASEGAIFKINIIREDLTKAINILKDRNFIIYGTDVINGMPPKDIKVKNNFALIVGNEGNGVRPNIKDLCDKNIYININKDLESLNVSIATAIILYEFNR